MKIRIVNNWIVMVVGKIQFPILTIVVVWETKELRRSRAIINPWQEIWICRWDLQVKAILFVLFTVQ